MIKFAVFVFYFWSSLTLAKAENRWWVYDFTDNPNVQVVAEYTIKIIDKAISVSSPEWQHSLYLVREAFMGTRIYVDNHIKDKQAYAREGGNIYLSELTYESVFYAARDKDIEDLNFISALFIHEAAHVAGSAGSSDWLQNECPATQLAAYVLQANGFGHGTLVYTNPCNLNGPIIGGPMFPWK